MNEKQISLLAAVHAAKVEYAVVGGVQDEEANEDAAQARSKRRREA